MEESKIEWLRNLDDKVHKWLINSEVNTEISEKKNYYKLKIWIKPGTKRTLFNSFLEFYLDIYKIKDKEKGLEAFIEIKDDQVCFKINELHFVLSGYNFNEKKKLEHFVNRIFLVLSNHESFKMYYDQKNLVNILIYIINDRHLMSENFFTIERLLYEKEYIENRNGNIKKLNKIKKHLNSSLKLVDYLIGMEE